MKKQKTLTNKIVNKQEIQSVSVDAEGGLIKVDILMSRHRNMPADADHPTPYVLVDNKTVSSITLTSDDLSLELDNLITKIDSLI
jgi:hypothetical protein